MKDHMKGSHQDACCEETFINGVELMLYEQVAAALDLVILMNSHLSTFKFRDYELHQSLI